MADLVFEVSGVVSYSDNTTGSFASVYNGSQNANGSITVTPYGVYSPDPATTSAAPSLDFRRVYENTTDTGDVHKTAVINTIAAADGAASTSLTATTLNDKTVTDFTLRISGRYTTAAGAVEEFGSTYNSLITSGNKYYSLITADATNGYHDAAHVAALNLIMDSVWTFLTGNATVTA